MFREDDWRRAPDFSDDPAHLARVRAATVADRELYTRSRLTPVACRYCHQDVLVRKSSPEQTSIQWTAGSTSSCPEYPGARPVAGPAFGSGTCPRLKASIDHAVAEGLLPFDSDVNPIGVPPADAPIGPEKEQ